MQIVINIDEDTYKDIIKGKVYSSMRDVPQESVLAIANGTPLPKEKWIPVSERMPKDRQMVLFCDIEDDIKIGYHIKGRPNTHFSQDGTFDDIKNVKAWMPLPEPYVAESEDKG